MAALKDKQNGDKFCRVTYNEITAPAIRKAFAEPREINQSTRWIPSRPAACWTASWATRSARCCGGASAAPPARGGCSRWRCAWCASASADPEFQAGGVLDPGREGAQAPGPARCLYRSARAHQRGEGRCAHGRAGPRHSADLEGRPAGAQIRAPRNLQAAPTVVHHQHAAAGGFPFLRFCPGPHNEAGAEAVRRRGFGRRRGGSHHVHAHRFSGHLAGGPAGGARVDRRKIRGRVSAGFSRPFTVAVAMRRRPTKPSGPPMWSARRTMWRPSWIQTNSSCTG
jgi:hypothetical protein